MLPPEEDITNYTWWNGQAEPKKGKWYYLLEEPFTFTLDLRNGAKSDPGVEEIKELIIDNFTLYYAAKNVQDGTGTISLKELIDNSTTTTKNECEVTANGDGTYKVEITGLGTYTVNGDRVQYALQYGDKDGIPYSNIKLPATGVSEDNNDWLTVEYKTQGVNNDKVFHGDTMVLTLQGHTTYTANKVWLDMDDKGKRPKGHFELWRYRAGKGETWKQASPVRDGENILKVELDTEKNQTIRFVDANGQPIQLDKYGPEGYEYVYVCKEIIEPEESSDYEQVFGKVNDDGTVTDTPPEGMEGVERQEGNISYTHLLLVGEDDKQINYQIVEVSTPDGYNRLTEPIAVSFEALTTEKPALSWTISGNKLLASEVTYTIHNNQYFQTINTGAGGFFWPGVAGAGAACAGVWYLAGRKRRKHNKRHSDR